MTRTGQGWWEGVRGGYGWVVFFWSGCWLRGCIHFGNSQSGPLISTILCTYTVLQYTMTSWYRVPFRVPFISMVSFSSSLGGPHHSKFHWSQTRSLLSPDLPLGDHFSSGTRAALGHRAMFPPWSSHLPPTVPTGRGLSFTRREQVVVKVWASNRHSPVKYLCNLVQVT